MFKKKKEQPKKKKEDISEIGKRHNLRVSTPYGYYPNDVDEVIKSLEAQVNQYENSLTKLHKEYNEVKEKHDMLFAEITRLKLEMQLIGIPDEENEETVLKLNL